MHVFRNFFWMLALFMSLQMNFAKELKKNICCCWDTCMHAHAQIAPFLDLERFQKWRRHCEASVCTLQKSHKSRKTTSEISKSLRRWNTQMHVSQQTMTFLILILAQSQFAVPWTMQNRKKKQKKAEIAKDCFDENPPVHSHFLCCLNFLAALIKVQCQEH